VCHTVVLSLPEGKCLVEEREMPHKMFAVPVAIVLSYAKTV